MRLNQDRLYVAVLNFLQIIKVRKFMINRLKADFFDLEAASDWSSKDYASEELAKVRRIFEAANLSDGDMVFEPGCGSGRLTRLIAQTIAGEGRVTAAEISSKMLDQASLRVQGLTNVTLVLGAVEDVITERETFNVVLCHNVFPHLDDKSLAISILGNALKARGRFIVSHFMSSSEVNSLHRKTNPAVAHDFLPDHDQMKKLFESSGMFVEYISDDDKGYLLKALRTNHS